MGIFKYITNRTLLNRKGEEKGKIRVVVKNGSNTAETDYTCPECGHSEHLNLTWKKPFNVKCTKCGFLVKIARLKDEMKKEKKKHKE